MRLHPTGATAYPPVMNWIEVLGWVGSAVLVVSLLQTRVLWLRAINLAGCILLLVYNAVIEVWPMVGLQLVLSVINVFYLWRMLRSRDDAAAFTVLEVEPEDRYLQHVLRVHADDIGRYNPGFRHDPTADQLAFLVLQGDETVGAVLARDAGEGTAEVTLDWVTPRHRDLSPGQFVFRESGMFARRGFTRVLSPEGMRHPYYERIGFTPAGDRWELAVPGAR